MDKKKKKPKKGYMSLLALMTLATPAAMADETHELCIDSYMQPPACAQLMDQQCFFLKARIGICLSKYPYPVNIACVADSWMLYVDGINALFSQPPCLPDDDDPDPDPDPEARSTSTPKAIFFARAMNLENPKIFRGVDLWRD